jgi:catechol-2,3-dioxygenase
MLFDSLQAVVIHISDMTASRRFYRDVLGLAPLHEDTGVSVYSTGNSEVCLVLAPGAVTPSLHSYPNLRCADASAVRTTLLARGATCSELAVSGPVSWFSVHDPDGNRVDCCQFDFGAY